MYMPLTSQNVSDAFVYKHSLLCSVLSSIKPTFSEAECILSALPDFSKSIQYKMGFPPIIFYLIDASMANNVLIDNTLITGDYSTPFEYLHEVLTHFGTALIAKQQKPQCILVDTPYTYSLLSSFCSKCGIELKLVEKLKYAYQFAALALCKEPSALE